MGTIVPGIGNVIGGAAGAAIGKGISLILKKKIKSFKQ